MNHPKMTSNGRRWALLIGAIIAFALPKQVVCGFPGSDDCSRIVGRERCSSTDVEPWGFYLIELLVRRNVGFAYSSSDDCR